MKSRATKGTRGQPEQSRKAILDAASVEFSNAGYDGARIDAIAKSAKVNKALLYYYFHDKEALYGAVLDDNFRGLLEELIRILDTDKSEGYKMLAYALTHFDYVTAHPHYRRPGAARDDARRGGKFGALPQAGRDLLSASVAAGGAND